MVLAEPSPRPTSGDPNISALVPARDHTAITHLPALDGVRGLAILLVIACHTTDHLATQAHWDTTAGRLIHSTLDAGWVGVDLFFVLSGFLITRILIATRGQPHFFRNFYARRALRILPLYLAFCASLQWQHHSLRGGKGDLLSLLLYYNNVRDAFWGWHTLPALQCWSLAVEEHFYLIWPTVIAFAPLRHLRAICIAGIALSFLARIFALTHHLPMHAVYILTPFRLDGLLVGAWLAEAFRHPDTWDRVRRYARPVMLVAALALLSIAVYQQDFATSHPLTQISGIRHSSLMVLGPGLLLLSIFFGGLLVRSLSGGWSTSFLRQGWLRSLGKYSYGMYLFHLAIMIWCRQQIVHHAPSLLGSWKLEPLFMALVLALTFAAAFVSFHLYEQPFLRLKRNFPST